MDINQEIQKAFEIIQQGGIILYPTDTVWGIGCDATNEEAIAKIYKLKQRDDSKSMIVLMNGEKMMYNVFKDIPEVAWQIIDLSEKPTTLILDNPRNVAKNIIAEDKTLGVRLVKEPFCFKLMERMKKPLVSTSANISGQPTPIAFKDISPEIIKGVANQINPDCVIVVDALSASSSSRLGTTVQLSDVGIAPGSGVGNHRYEISKQTLGVPVISIGIPTVVSTSVICGNDDSSAMFVTPREIDRIIEHGAKLIGMTVNMCLQKNIDAKDLFSLVG